ncbi:hypothetical protein RJ639_021002 [Escallonia herrerae]|uniref:Uncharacterized protein n=1 Tax=Escallonia herrerae TaxID=1293975 RepID=A0AA88V5L7_9ASTE|nr:hypothetical protein RJ639_021002 [Escallonia herrerae]
MAAALASRPEVGSSMNMIEGLATSSTAIVNLFLCSVDRPVIPGSPTIASFRTSISVVFPAPLIPISAVKTPGLNAPLTSRNSSDEPKDSSGHLAHYLLQEVSRSLALWALEPTGLKELDHVLPWALVHDLAFRQEDDVVEEIERLRSGLEEGHQYGVLG